MSVDRDRSPDPGSAPPSVALPVTTGRTPDEGPAEHLLKAAAGDVFDVEPPYEPEESDLPDDRFLDREVSWLRFNTRVLELAEDDSLPLLERTRFLAIFASNLDEFFMVRVAGLKRRLAAGVAVQAASGLMPREVLEAIWRESRELMERHGQVFIKPLFRGGVGKSSARTSRRPPRTSSPSGSSPC